MSFKHKWDKTLHSLFTQPSFNQSLLLNKEWLHHVGTRSLNRPVWPSFSWLHSFTGRPQCINLIDTTQQREAPCKPCFSTTTQTKNQKEIQILLQVTPTFEKKYLYQTHTVLTNTSLIAQLSYKGHPGVAASRSWPCCHHGEALPQLWLALPLWILNIYCVYAYMTEKYVWKQRLRNKLLRFLADWCDRHFKCMVSQNTHKSRCINHYGHKFNVILLFMYGGWRYYGDTYGTDNKGQTAQPSVDNSSIILLNNNGLLSLILFHHVSHICI